MNGPKDNEAVEQILNLIDKSKKILLLTHAKADADGLGAMISVYLVLKDLGKQVTAVTNDPAPDSLDFLPAINIVQNSLASAKDFIITLDCRNTAVNKIKYNLEDSRVNIIISPKSGQFKASDVSFAEGAAETYDLIITFDAGNLEHLGPIYDQNADMFFKTPVVNIDHHASNTDFGRVNLVDMVAAATTEVVYSFLLQMEKRTNKKLISPDIATLLLAGLITDTGSFQHSNTSPQAMETAAELMDLGARQQEIIKHIYKTKKLSTLKLWGITLSKVQVDPVYRMVWSTISKDDLREAGADSEESGNIIDDLLSNAPGAEVIILIKYGTDGVISVSMRSTNNQVDVGKLCAEMGGGGHVRAAGSKVRDGRSFEQVVSEVITKTKEFQAKRLNIHPEGLEKAKAAAQVNGRPAPEEPKPATTASKSNAGLKKETYLNFKVEPKKVPPVPATAPLAVPTEKSEERFKKKRKRRRGKKSGEAQGLVSNPAPALKPTIPVVKSALPVVKTPAPKPAVSPPVTTLSTPPVPPASSVTPVPPAPAQPIPVPPVAPVLVAPSAPLTTPSAPHVSPTPPVHPVLPTPSKPMPKPDVSPDVPDWLKAE